MQIAKVNVAAPVYVPSGEYLDGAVLAEPAWARRGQHTMSAEFARTQDAAGLPIDAATKLMDGTPIDGPDGLRSYLLNDRRDTFERQFCRKLLGYGLGRAVQLSDEPLLDEIQTMLAGNGHRVHVAIEAIVSSPQFRDIRGADAVDDGE
jgi:hypothetical protein